jgi:hypothetical protein
MGHIHRTHGIQMLSRYVDNQGHAHTYMPIEKGESWSTAHADVTPVIGMALLCCNADRISVDLVRNAVMMARQSSSVWDSFWWASEAYATARSLEFLRASGGIPVDVAVDAERWLETTSVGPTNTISASQRLLASCALARPSPGAIEVLFELQRADGSWPQSAALLLPPNDNSGAEGVRHSDSECVLGTAMALVALKTAATRLDLVG